MPITVLPNDLYDGLMGARSGRTGVPIRTPKAPARDAIALSGLSNSKAVR